MVVLPFFAPYDFQRGQRGGDVGMEGENLLQSHDFEDVLHAGAERGEGQLALEALHGLKIFDQRGQAGGIDVIHSGEIEQQARRLFGRLGLEELPQFGRGFQVDIAGNRDDRYVFLGSFGNLHQDRGINLPA